MGEYISREAAADRIRSRIDPFSTLNPGLYQAMGFPEDYRIDHDYLGREYPKTQQVARCGNAVCPPMARAVVAANMPEWCAIDISTMAKLMEVVAG